MENIPAHYEEVYRSMKESTDVFFTHWVQYCLFSTPFWCNLIFCFLVIFIWIRLLDKSRIMEIFLFGLIWQIVAETLDDIGTTYLLWAYPLKVTPLHTVFLTNLILIPISFMTIYQYCKTWKSFIIASVCFSAFSAFVMEPLYTWAGMYLPLHWKHIYSFPIYSLLAVLIRYAVLYLKRLQSR